MHAIGVEAVGVTKRFGTFTALDNVSLRIAKASVHALLGENGAGKSTLVKCLLGYYRADEGSFIVDTREATIERPADADRLGLGMVYQHFTLVPSMTAAENLVMSRADVPQVIDWKAERARLETFLERMPFRVPLDAPVGSLASGERQKTEILKQLYLDRRFLVLDEPTSTLTPSEAEEVLGLIRAITERGDITTVIITHKLKEVAAFADEVTVLRKGRVAGGSHARTLGPADLTALMIGELDVTENPDRRGTPEGAPRLRLRGLRSEAGLGRRRVDIDTLDVRPGEILGVAGISGNGQSTLVEIIGGQRKPAAGDILVSGAAYHARREEAQALKVRVLPEEPLRNGCVPSMSVRDNLNLRRFDRDKAGRRRAWPDRADMAAWARGMIAAYGIKAPSDQVPISALSGGNVQRTVLARELDGTVALLVAANPCFGLDVKAVSEIRARIVAARNAGTAVLLLSEDLDEILELSDRIVVMREGSIVYETAGAGADARTIGGHMVGRG
ncbi:MAG TPA: ABC transporter ATP-binding protein [Xanthobacteraceae bacterium]|nr:ABC transporter ATP-binding protein [Xanthobacteraceae bacterium]